MDKTDILSRLQREVIARAICHDEQLEIWADEFLEHFGHTGFLHLPETYEEKIKLNDCVKAAIRDLIEKAFEMADDIAACPHSLAERETAVADGMCPICSAAENERLTAEFELSKHVSQHRGQRIRDLESENEQLKIDKITLGNFGCLPAYRSQEAQLDHLRKRIYLLKAERDDYKERARMCLDLQEAAEAELDEAKDDYLRRHKDVGDQMELRIKAEAERDALKEDFERERAACGEAYRQREELRAERDVIADDNARWKELHDAVRAKAFKECETIVSIGTCSCAKTIRERAQMDEGKT